MIEKIASKAVLIYPEFDTQDTFWSYASSLKMYAPLGEFGLPKRLLPPLGLMGLYNHLKPYYDEIYLIDKNVNPAPLSDLVTDAEHVFIGGMLAQEQSLIKLAVALKQMGKLVIAGGTAITPDSALMTIADHLFENEVEGVIDEFLQALKQGTAKKYYKGNIVDAEHFLQPDYSSINMQNYVHMAVQISRGCPESCEFCDIPLRFGKAYRVTLWQHTEQSFRQMKALGWTGQVFIVDDNFIANPRKALDVLKSLYKIGENIGYHHPKYTELTLRLADDSPIMAELRQWFHQCNFINGFYGVETPNEASLLETKKKQNLRGEKTLVDKLNFISQHTGGGVMMGMIYGFDHDTDETVDEFIAFVNASNAPVVMAGLLNALPYTGLMRRMEKQGRLLKASSGNNSDGIINFIPYHFSVKQAEQNYLLILDGIYHPKAYFDRVMRHLQLIDPSLQSQYRQGNEKLIYLLKILSKNNALSYWQYLPKALLIATKRCWNDKPGFVALVAEYFSLCGQYTHFKHQIKVQNQKISQRDYNKYQQLSWQQIENSVVEQEEIQALMSHSVSG
ncbi:MAG: DUF4070 domain-containing protein [Methylococcales symbiont of Hymedesmia sp. n. MRB-2018]|nr:MAG: DUF4070 domain-containing protein [Methylococcales symbiont of Hymedesmia sp. n. MRB-2018]